MIESNLLNKLEELKQQFRAFEQYSHERPIRARALLLREFTGLQRKLEEVRTIVSQAPETNGAESSALTPSEESGRRIVRHGSVRRTPSAPEPDPASAASLDPERAIDQAERVVVCDPPAEAFFWHRRDDVKGHELRGLVVPPRTRTRLLSGFAHHPAKGKVATLGKRYGAFAPKANSSTFPVEVGMTATGVEEPATHPSQLSAGPARAGAEQEALLCQERARSLSTSLSLVEEHERRRLADDLHEGLSQTIALTQIKLSGLRHSMNGELDHAFEEVKDLIDLADRSARLISFELSPPVWDELGLESVLRWLVEILQVRYGIPIVLEDDGRPKPADEKTRVVLFRSIRELLFNAARHAGASRVHVRLERKEDCLRASIADDGIGMEPNTDVSHGSGLFGIHERLSCVGGSMHIESAPGRGTKIHLCAPLENGTSQQVRIET